MASKVKTYLYVLKLTFVTAAILAGLYNVLEPIHQTNKKNAKRKSILKCIPDLSINDDVKAQFEESIQIAAVTENGQAFTSKDELNGFRPSEYQYDDLTDLDLSVEERKVKEKAKRVAPLYTYTGTDGRKTYIIALIGKGLWDKIWGYVAFDENMIVKGVSFDHKAETPGLGAEIKDSKDFKNAFQNKQIFKGKNVLLSVKKKGLNQKYDVKTISGATVTSDGVDDMLKVGFNFYLSYFEKMVEKGELAYRFK